MNNSEYRQPTHREELERELVHGASSQIAHAPESAAAIAKGIKTVLDELAPVAPHPAAIAPLPALDHGPDSLEREIQAKGLTAPRVTPADIEANIASEHYFTAGEGVIGAFVAGEFGAHGGDTVAVRRGIASPEVLKPSLNLLTFCVLVLRNGFTVTGESACASPENFDAEIGRRIARENAVQKIWPLLGYELRTKLAAD